MASHCASCRFLLSRSCAGKDCHWLFRWSSSSGAFRLRFRVKASWFDILETVQEARVRGSNPHKSFYEAPMNRLFFIEPLAGSATKILHRACSN